MNKLMVAVLVLGVLVYMGLGTEEPTEADKEKSSISNSINAATNKAEGVEATLKEAEARRRSQMD